VIDDIDQNIDLIVRGEDLLSSTARQLAMRSMIAAQANPPIFAHHPLLQNQEGQKLSKRIHSEAIKALRQQGKTPSEVRQLAKIESNFEIK
jgi:glutamyl/glutaminyl-tRNA synthetase